MNSIELISSVQLTEAINTTETARILIFSTASTLMTWSALSLSMKKYREAKTINKIMIAVIPGLMVGTHLYFQSL